MYKENHSDMATNGVRQRRLWTVPEDELLRDTIYQIGTHWTQIQLLLPHRTIAQCQQRWKRIKPQETKRKKWTSDEDQIICSLYSELGPKWSKIASSLQGRTGMQVRMRFINQLDPSIEKRKWTLLEDDELFNQFIIHGPIWSVIATYFEGRSGNDIKNRFYSHTKHAYLGIKCPYQTNVDFGQSTLWANKIRSNIIKEQGIKRVYPTRLITKSKQAPKKILKKAPKKALKKSPRKSPKQQQKVKKVEEWHESQDYCTTDDDLSKYFEMTHHSVSGEYDYLFDL